MTQQRRPDFFIVGAPKSGTTALSEYLKAHPDIFMPYRKELAFFGADLQYTPFALHDDTTAQYMRHYAGWRAEKRAGEASVWYLYSKVAASEIKAFSPAAQIIIMLRNPVDVMYANYSQMRFNGNEDLPTFEEALAAEESRKRGQRIPSTALLVDALFYRDTVRYTEQVCRYFDVFGRDRVLVIIHDDFLQDNDTIYQQTLTFLDVDPHFQPAFAIVNPNKEVRSLLLRNALKNPLFVALAHRFPRLAYAVNARLRRLNTRYVARPPLSPELRQVLQREFLPEVEQLSQLLDRDLTHWCAG